MTELLVLRWMWIFRINWGYPSLCFCKWTFVLVTPGPQVDWKNHSIPRLQVGKCLLLGLRTPGECTTFLRLVAYFLPRMPALMVKLPSNWENWRADHERHKFQITSDLLSLVWKKGDTQKPEDSHLPWFWGGHTSRKHRSKGLCLASAQRRKKEARVEAERLSL